MKPAADSTTGEVVETTTRRRVVPSNELNQAKPDIWAYLASLGSDPTAWSKHMVYVYLVENGALRPILKCSEAVALMPDGIRVPIADQQEMEFALARLSGGTYRIMVKRGVQIVAAESIPINAPARPIPTAPVAPSANQPSASFTPNASTDPTAAVASRAMDALSMQERQSAEIGFSAMRTAAEVMDRYAKGSQNDATAQMLRELILEMRAQRQGMNLQEILAAVTSGIGILKELGVLGQNANPALNKLLDSAIERFMNPAPAGNPINTSTALVQALPTIGSQFVEGLRAFAEARKHEAEIFAMQARHAAPPVANAQLLPPSQPQANPAPPAATPGQPTMEFVERKILEIFQRPTSAEQAADDAMAFLDNLDPNAVASLAALGEEKLLQYFAGSPILNKATANMQRLVDFIKAFMRMHAEDVAAEKGRPAQPPSGEPLPN